MHDIDVGWTDAALAISDRVDCLALEALLLSNDSPPPVEIGFEYVEFSARRLED